MRFDTFNCAITGREAKSIIAGEKTALAFPIIPIPHPDIREWFKEHDTYYGYIKQKYGQESEAVCPFEKNGGSFALYHDDHFIALAAKEVKPMKLQDLDPGRLIFPERDYVALLELEDENWFWLVEFEADKHAMAGAA